MYFSYIGFKVKVVIINLMIHLTIGRPLEHVQAEETISRCSNIHKHRTILPSHIGPLQ